MTGSPAQGKGGARVKYNEEYKLCYVTRPWAYFTTQELDKQWGDDWNDAPYEHNAGAPYTWPATAWDANTQRLGPNTQPRWEVVKVPFDANLATPEDEHFNSPYSVQAINDRSVAWLRPYRWDREHEAEGVEIWAGTTYPEFVRLIQEAGGTVYEPVAAIELEPAP